LISAPGLLLADSYSQINLVSNVPGLAATTDPNLKNPWGESNSATSPFWISNQGSGTATLYNGAGVPTPLIVSIPGSSTPPSGPTGQVSNNSTGFLVNGTKSNFIFDTLNGTIAAWNGSAGTTAVTMASTPGAIYTGLAQGNVGTSTYLYAADSTGHVNVFDSNWTNVTGTTFAGKFVDPGAIAGYVPFNIQLIGSNLYVTYASLTPMGTGLPGGYVDVFDTNGNFIQRIATGGALYAPWGVTVAPSEFGTYSNDLLIGNFGNGEILAYNPITDAYLGTLNGSNGMPLDNPFLWSLETRTGGTAIDPNAVYFTAGIDNQKDGLFGDIVFTPEPSTLIEAGSGLIALALARLRRR
jgi:uncharacterized protein (TIGR03118 family)